MIYINRKVCGGFRSHLRSDYDMYIVPVPTYWPKLSAKLPRSAENQPSTDLASELQLSVVSHCSPAIIFYYGQNHRNWVVIFGNESKINFFLDRRTRKLTTFGAAYSKEIKPLQNLILKNEAHEINDCCLYNHRVLGSFASTPKTFRHAAYTCLQCSNWNNLEHELST